jgi:hypothetical protein
MPVSDLTPGSGGAADALLIRPDGHICWAGNSEFTGLKEALERWFGPAVHDVGVSGWRNSHQSPGSQKWEYP